MNALDRVAGLQRNQMPELMPRVVSLPEGPSTTAITSPARLVATPVWRAYWELTKPKIVALIVFTSFVGMLMARRGLPRWDMPLWAALGIALSSGCAAVLNHVLDRHIDERMARTRMRPLPAGKVTPRRAMIFACVLGVTGTVVLARFVNGLTAVLTVAALIGYGYIYTAWLKRATPQNIVIGGAAGAAAPVLGWTAVADRVELGALILFSIILLWTPPHFWSLAIARRREYALTGIPMLPVTHGVPYTQSQIVSYTILLWFVTMLPALVGMTGMIYLIAALVLDSRFLYLAVKLKTHPLPNLPMRVFRYSISYLAWLFAALLVDHYWHLPL